MPYVECLDEHATIAVYCQEVRCRSVFNDTRYKSNVAAYTMLRPSRPAIHIHKRFRPGAPLHTRDAHDQAGWWPWTCKPPETEKSSDPDVPVATVVDGWGEMRENVSSNTKRIKKMEELLEKFNERLHTLDGPIDFNSNGDSKGTDDSNLIESSEVETSNDQDVLGGLNPLDGTGRPSAPDAPDDLDLSSMIKYTVDSRNLKPSIKIKGRSNDKLKKLYPIKEEDEKENMKYSTRFSSVVSKCRKNHSAYGNLRV